MNSVNITTRFLGAFDDRLHAIRDTPFANQDVLIDLSNRLHRLNPPDIVEAGTELAQGLTEIVNGLNNKSISGKDAYDRTLELISVYYNAVPRLYERYALYYKNAINLLHEIDAKAKHMAKHRRALQEISDALSSLELRKPNGEVVTDPHHELKSSIIAPIQRLPRYQLLIKDLKETAADAGLDPERKGLQVLKTILDNNRIINDQVDK